MVKYQKYAEYKDSGVEWFSNLPIAWRVGKLKQIVDQNRQITYGIVQAGPNIENGVPYIRPADMSDEKGIKNFDELLRTSESIASSYDRSKIKSGDIICSIGPSFGKVMITPAVLDGANLTQGTARIAISSENNPRYFFWSLRSTISFSQWESVVGGATFRALNLGPLADTYIALPSFDEQEKIANFLDHETAKIDTLIAKQEKLIELLKEKRQAVISHAVTKGLNPNVPMKNSGVEWLGEVPEHWDVCKIKYYAKIESGHTPSKTNERYWENCTIPWVSLNDSKQLRVVDYISDTKYKISELGLANSSARILPKDTVVFTRDASIGLSAITTKEMAVSQHLIAWLPKKERLSPEFLLLIFYAMEKEFNRYTFGSTIKTIGMDDVSSLVAAFPSLVEQLDIVKTCFSQFLLIDKSIEKSLALLAILKEKRTALISAAVTGKIDVRHWQNPHNNNNQDNMELSA